jgi:hypothetical protein
MKILFLDIDGVLNSVRSCIAFDGYPYSNSNYEKFDDIAVNLIRKLCKTTNTKIILSSTWRLFKGWDKLYEVLNLPIIDKTPHKLSSTRGEEIDMWLSNNKVDKYAIVDDDSDILVYQLPYFVKVDNTNGLSYENYLQLLKLLK